MSFWEFDVACDGWESFHASAEEDPADRAPTAEQHYAALGIRMQ